MISIKGRSEVGRLGRGSKYDLHIETNNFLFLVEG